MKKKPQVTSSSNDQALTTIVILFHFLLFATPLFFSFNTSELFEFNKMIFTYAVTVLIAGAWVTRMVLRGQVILKRTYLDVPIILFVISQFLSTIFSIHPSTSLLGYYSRFHGGLLSTLTYVVLYYAFVSNVKKKHLPSLFITTFASGFLVSLYAALEHLGHSFSCFMVSNGQSFGVDCWIQDVKTRVFASFGQPNWLAAYLIMLIPLGTALSLQLKQKNILRYIYAAVTVLFFLVVLYTRSRSGFFGIAAGMGVFALLAVAKWRLWKLSSIGEFISAKKLPLSLLIGGVLLVVAYYGTPISPSITQLSSSTSTVVQAPPSENTAPVINRLDVGGSDSGEIRKIVWEGAVKVWQRYPILGSGVETFAYSYYLDRPAAHNMVSEWDFLYNKAHNEFLNYLATTGLVGLISYVVLLGWVGFIAVRKIFTTDTLHDTALLLIAIISGITALSVSNFFGFSTVMVTVMMYLYFGIVSVLNDPPLVIAEAKPVNKNASELSYLYFSILAMVCVFLLNMVYQYWKADVLYAKGSSLLNAGYFTEGTAALQSAIKKNPEAEFYDELATQYSRYAWSLAQENELQDAQTLMAASIAASDMVMKLNSHQLNFYKTRAGTFITLAQMNEKMLKTAKETLEKGATLAPTDAKLIYNLGVVKVSLGEKEAGSKDLEKAVELKPNYEAARLQLANVYDELGRKDEALKQVEYIVNEIAPHNQAALDKIASLSATIKK